MTSKERRLAKQNGHAAKLFDDIITGKTKLAVYERPKKQSQANRKGGSTPTAESEAALISDHTRLLRMLLPGIITKLSTIEDPRRASMCDHTMATLILYGIIIFLSHMPSRRAANRELGGESSFSMLRDIVPELESMPHADTLARLLEKIDVDKMEECYSDLLRQFMKSDCFRKINPGKCLIAIDGTQLYSMDYCFDRRALVRWRGDETRERHCVYMLESVLILDNGAVLPLLTETLENEDFGKDEEQKKQDCELKAFGRLADRLVKLVGKGCATLVLDGLYAGGPVISQCKSYGWDYMIVLKSGSMPAVWEDFEGLRKIELENELKAECGGRMQSYAWSNGIEYTYGNNHKRMLLNIVTCKETWIEYNSRKGTKPKQMETSYAWLSSERISHKNVLELCNAIARRRWCIENHFHVEKNDGYNMTHCYSYNWDAMKGFHTLMKYAHFMNTLIAHSYMTKEYVKADGISGFIRKVWKLILSSRTGTVIANEAFETQKRRKRISFRGFEVA